jgi:uncharacterized membrane protein
MNGLIGKVVGRQAVLVRNPVLLEHARERSKSVENRIADHVTELAGSMRFVYMHVVWFALWIGLGVESYPFGLLTMIVSLESIFLSSFVMISQNRSDEKRVVLANQEWQTVQDEDSQNEELIGMSKRILELTQELHRHTVPAANGTAVAPASDSRDT